MDREVSGRRGTRSIDETTFALAKRLGLTQKKGMNYDQYVQKIEGGESLDTLSGPLQALAAEKRGDWHEAHRLCQDAGDGNGAWVHAYLHRVEGDNSNAAYWYSRAKQPVAKTATAEEWEAIARTLLDQEQK